MKTVNKIVSILKFLWQCCHFVTGKEYAYEMGSETSSSYDQIMCVHYFFVVYFNYAVIVWICVTSIDD